MGKTVTAGENVQKCIEDTVSKGETVVGLVLGQGGDQRDHVVHLVRTPLESEGNKEELPANSKPAIEDWDVDLIAQHARQVTRLLPGGFDVLGLFVCTTSADQFSTSAVAVCKQLMMAIHKMHSKFTIHSESFTKEQILLHMSCAPYKVSCKTVDVTSALANPKPVDFKIANTRWQCLQCCLAINLTIPLAKKHTNSSLIKQIRIGLQPLCASINEAVYLVDGQTRNPDDAFELQSGHKKGKQLQRDQQDKLPILTVDLLTNSNSSTLESRLIEQDCNITMQVRGTIQGRTYVPSTATIRDGIQCLKLDMLRSLIGRCEIHCEDLLVIDEEQLDRVVVHELPCRVFAPLPNCDVTVSDYLFPGEKAKDSLDALSELFDLSLVADDVETCCERLPETSDLTPSPTEAREICNGVQMAEMLPPKPLTSCNYILIGLSIAVAVLAGGTSLYLLR